MIVSLYASATAPAPVGTSAFEQVLGQIRAGNYRLPVKAVREAADKASRAEAKKRLPAFTVSGTFSHRVKEGLEQHSGLIALDIDAAGNPGQAVRDYRKLVEADAYTFAGFVSAGGEGYCAIVRIPTEAHEDSFRALETYYREELGLTIDTACKDVGRLRFFSYDPLLFHNPEAEVFDVIEAAPAPKPAPAAALVAESRPSVRGEGYGQVALRRACEKVSQAADGQKHITVNKMAFLCGGYIGAGLLNEAEARDALQATISGRDVASLKQAFKTIDDGLKDGQLKPVLPEEQKHYVHKQLREGRSPADVAAVMGAAQGLPVGPLASAITAAKQELDEQPELLTWWDVVDPGNDKPLKLLISKHRYRAWLASAGGFRRLTDENAPDGSIVVQAVGTVVRRVKRADIVAFVQDFLEGLPFVFDGAYRSLLEEQVETMQRVLLSMEGMQLLPELAGTFLRDTATVHHSYFQDCWVEVTAEGVAAHPYEELPGLIWDAQRKPRPFKTVSGDVARAADFHQFTVHLTAGDAERLDQLQRALGYLIHNYKDVTNARAVILMDEIGEVGRSSGGTGKGLLTQGVGEMVKVSTIDGSSFDFKDPFRFEEVADDASVVFLDEWRPQRNSFELLFSALTGGMPINRKHQPKKTIPFALAPKFVIATNDIVTGDDDSSERRKVEIALAKRYSATFTPRDDFGRPFFGEHWDEDEWLRFDNLALGWVQHFLTNGRQLLQLRNESIKARGLAQTVGVTFHEFAAELLEQARADEAAGVDARIWAPDAFLDYQNATGDKRTGAIVFNRKMEQFGFLKGKCYEAIRRKQIYFLPPSTKDAPAFEG